MMIYEHSTPLGLIGLGLILILLISAVSFWRYLPRKPVNFIMALLYVCFVLLAGWCLLLPGKRDVQVEKLKPRFVVALDVSSSMLTRPAETISNRWFEAQQVLALPWMDAVAADCTLEYFTFSNKLSARMTGADVAQLTPGGPSTLLRDSVQELARRYAGMNVAGALLLTDGTDTREASEDWAVEVRPFPIYTVRLEPDVEWAVEPDLRIDSATTPRRCTVDWKTELTTVISGQGSAGQPITVQLFKDEVLYQEKPIQLTDSGAARETTFELDHPEVGVFSYRVQVPPLPGESNTNDNSYVMSVRVVDAKNRLLYVEGPPRWEYKYLRRALISNRKITPVIFYAGFDGKPYGGVPVGNMTSDMTESELAFFKVVVLGNLDAEALTEVRARNLVHFVESGGSLVLLGGTGAWGPKGVLTTALRGILPVRKHSTTPIQGKEPYPVQLAAAGRAHPAFAGEADYWAVVPPVLTYFPGVELSAGAQELVDVVTSEGRHPIVVSQRYGDGKVVAILTDSLWKWQLSDRAAETKPYQRFWDQLIAWLLPSESDVQAQGIEIFASREGLYLGEELELSARLDESRVQAETQVRCMLTLPDKREVPYAMSAQPVTTAAGKTYPGYVLPFTADVPGLYTARAITGDGDHATSSETVSFFVKPFTPESMPRPVNTAVLESVARSSGGQYYETSEQLDAGLSAIHANPIEEETVELRSLWQTWPVISLLMLLISTTWIIRKLQNMP